MGIARDMCKHHIAVIFTFPNISQQDIIQHYGTWYGLHCGRLGHMFPNPQHIPNDMGSDDDNEDGHFDNDDGIMEFNVFMNMEQSDFPMGAIVGSNDTINSSTPLERALAQLATIMQEITNECKKADVTLCEHATSHMRILACNIHNICLTKANAISHPRLVLHHIKDGLGNNVKWLKDWHETMFNHTNVRTKQCHE
jgi:hypothetical protein